MRTRVIKLFHAINVSKEPTGNQPSGPGEASNVHALKQLGQGRTLSLENFWQMHPVNNFHQNE